jgi:hypothetical protein
MSGIELALAWSGSDREGCTNWWSFASSKALVKMPKSFWASGSLDDDFANHRGME